MNHHVVVVGDIGCEVFHLLEEYFSDCHRMTPFDQQVVILSSRRDGALQYSIAQCQFQHRVKFIVGTALRDVDLARVRADNASAVLVVANRFAWSTFRHPSNIDSIAVIRATAVRRFSPSARVLVQLNSAHDLHLNLVLNLENTQVLCLERFRMNIMRQNVFCYGSAPLLYNLACSVHITFPTFHGCGQPVSSAQYERSAFQPVNDTLAAGGIRTTETASLGTWADMYKLGASHEVYTVAMSIWYVGMTFAEACSHMFSTFAVVLFAVEISANEKRRVGVKAPPKKYLFCPGHLYKIHKHDKACLICVDDRQAILVSHYQGPKGDGSSRGKLVGHRPTKVTNDYSVENDPVSDAEVSMEVTATSSHMVSTARGDGTSSSDIHIYGATVGEGRIGVRVGRAESADIKSGGKESPQQLRNLKRRQGRLVQRRITDIGIPGSVFNNAQNGDRRLLSGILGQVEEEGRGIKTESNAANGNFKWLNAQFDWEDMAERWGRSNEAALPDKIEGPDEMRHFQGHIIVCGWSNAIRHFLPEKGTRWASKSVVILHHTTPLLSEWKKLEGLHDNIYFVRGDATSWAALRRAGIEHRPYGIAVFQPEGFARRSAGMSGFHAASDAFALVIARTIYHHAPSMQITIELVCDRSVEMLPTNGDPPLSLIASGRLVMPSWNSLMCKTLFSSDVLSLCEMLVSGGHFVTSGTRRFQPHELIRVVLPEEFEGRGFGELFTHFVLEREGVPLGLYRNPIPFNAPQPFVACCPQQDALCHRGDAVFLLVSYNAKEEAEKLKKWEQLEAIRQAQERATRTAKEPRPDGTQPHTTKSNPSAK